MATRTPKLGLNKPSLPDKALVTLLNENSDVLDAIVYALSRSRYNLLDNSDFLHPVNQGGGTSYSAAGYDIDRWRHGNSNLTVAVTASGVKLTNASTTSGLAWQQLIDSNLSGKTVTVACCQSNGVIAVGTGIIPAEAVTSDTAIITARFADESGSIVLYKQSDGLISYRIFVGAGKAVTLEWAALYEGEYDVSTLPIYTPKGYAVELGQCRRYRITFDIGELIPWLSSTSARRYYIPFPQQMRGASPTVDSSGLRERNAWTDTAAAFEVSTSSKDGIVIICSSTVSSATGCHLGGTITVSKDL